MSPSGQFHLETRMEIEVMITEIKNTITEIKN